MLLLAKTEAYVTIPSCRKFTLSFTMPVGDTATPPLRCKPWLPSSSGLGSGISQFQELTDRFDVLRRLTGIRIQEQYNVRLLQNGWTLAACIFYVCCKPPFVFHSHW